MTLSLTIRLVIAACVVLGGGGVAFAQTSIYGLRIEGDVEAGGRVYIEEPGKRERAKFEEYRDLPELPFLAGARLRLFTPDEKFSIELGGSKWGQEDQEYFLSMGRPGLWNFGFEWDQIPHLLSTNARLLAKEGPDGVFTLPTPRPSLRAHNTAPELDELGTRWDIARFDLTLSPTPDIDLEAQYTRIKKSGERPFGVAFGSPGSNFYEVLRPVDETIHDARLKATFGGEWWRVQVGYALSIFQNDDSAVVADNPCFGLTAAVAAGGCGPDANAPAQGRVSLAPDNQAHTLSMAGAVNLPMRTRVAANLSYSLRFQDDTFLPHTSNSSIRSPLLALPQSDLNGAVGILLFNLNATSRPVPPLTLSLKYRLYDFNDMSDEITFPGHVVNDRTPVVVENRRASRFDYTKHNAELQGRWRFQQPVALTAGGGWERWDRVDHREVPTSDEYFAKLAVDTTPVDWLLARLTYRPSFRRISDYNTFAHLAHTVIEEDIASDAAQGQSVLLRKYDEADRDRQRVDLLLQFTPLDAFTIGPTASYRTDDYIDSRLGLQEAEAWSAGLDASWTPSARFSLSAGYVYESIDQKQRSRSREVVGTTVLDFVDFEWLSSNVDVVQTVYASARVALIPKTLDWSLGLSYSDARGEVKTRNPIPPTSGTAAQDASATAKPFPDTEDRLIRFETALRYFWKTWSVSLGYIFEKFDKSDYRTDTLNPFVPGVSSIWLGNDLKDYTAHIFVVTLGYRFR
jgi:MtrB/PioB family decaheme-associated outer membrane protein